MENEKKKVLFDALSDLDSLDSEIEDIIHLLAIYDENITRDMEPIQKGESYGDVYLRGRWPLHLSTLNVIRLRLNGILAELQTGVQKGYGALEVRA